MVPASSGQVIGKIEHRMSPSGKALPFAAKRRLRVGFVG